jgi:hypothetical protein
MPGDILQHLTFLLDAASARVGRLYFFQGLRELCDTVSCRIGEPARSCGRIPRHPRQIEEELLVVFTTTEPQNRNNPVPCPAKLFGVWIQLSTCSTITEMR